MCVVFIRIFWLSDRCSGECRCWRGVVGAGSLLGAEAEIALLVHMDTSGVNLTRGVVKSGNKSEYPDLCGTPGGAFRLVPIYPVSTGVVGNLQIQ